MRISVQRKGMILVFAIWVLAFLTILAVSVAAGIGQKIILVKRIDERSRLELCGASSGQESLCVYP